jgi:hypothetical protein
MDLVASLKEFKTTILAVVIFVLGVLPDVIAVLMNLQKVLEKANAVLAKGDIWALLAMKPLVIAFLGSVGLLLARDWVKKSDSE